MYTSLSQRRLIIVVRMIIVVSVVACVWRVVAVVVCRVPVFFLPVHSCVCVCVRVCVCVCV